MFSLCSRVRRRITQNLNLLRSYFRHSRKYARAWALKFTAIRLSLISSEIPPGINFSPWNAKIFHASFRFFLFAPLQVVPNLAVCRSTHVMQIFWHSDLFLLKLDCLFLRLRIACLFHWVTLFFFNIISLTKFHVRQCGIGGESKGHPQWGGYLFGLLHPQDRFRKGESLYCFFHPLPLRDCTTSVLSFLDSWKAWSLKIVPLNWSY